ncbi:MAG: hypothetical protein IPJ65_04275 [Archangiaceae bacterium]|nr:hypothetical protein [Archangiaceae bacterium]
MNRKLLAAAVLAVSCSHSRPEEMSAAEHRAEARVHQENARREAGQYNPGLTVQGPMAPRRYGDPAGNESLFEYNPTAKHLETADREMRRAADHLAAARSLEAFEAGACRDLAPAERSACPLLASWVTTVRDTRLGIELELKPEVDAADTHRRLDCHLAYAEAKGFERPSCPLFVKGMSIRLRNQRVLVFSGETPQVAKELQEQARRIFAPERIVPAAVSQTP